MNKLRTFAIIFIIFVLICGSILQLIYIRRTADELLPLSEQLCTDILKNRWDLAENTFRQLQKKWRKRHPALYYVTSHNRVDEIDAELSAFSEDLAAENHTQLPASAARIHANLESLMRTERFSLSNVF